MRKNIKNKSIWKIEDFIKDNYIKENIDNFQYNTISKKLNISITDIIEIIICLEEKGKVQHSYDIRDKNLQLIHSYKNIDLAIEKAKEIFDEDIDIINHIYISINLTKEYKDFLDNIKDVRKVNQIIST